MIIGEFNTSDFDGYEEDSYDYLFKKKPKGVRQEKRLARKENKQQKKGGILKGKRKLPLLGNFGMFDKNKKKTQPGNAANTETSSRPDENLIPTAAGSPEQPSLPEPVVAPAASVVPESAITSVKEGASAAAELRIPSSKINAIVPTADDAKEEQSSAARGILPVSVEPKIAEKEKGGVKGSNVKEAGFASILGFAFLGVTIILLGFALVKVDQKSKANAHPLKATV